MGLMGRRASQWKHRTLVQLRRRNPFRHDQPQHQHLRTGAFELYQHRLCARQHHLLRYILDRTARSQLLFRPVHRTGRPGADRQLRLPLYVAGQRDRFPRDGRLRREAVTVAVWKMAGAMSAAAAVLTGNSAEAVPRQLTVTATGAQLLTVAERLSRAGDTVKAKAILAALAADPNSDIRNEARF